MPTVFRSKGYRFFFYSNEGTEPCHIHVEGHGGEMKVWADPLGVAHVYKLSAKQQREIIEIVRKNLGKIEEAWRDHFSKTKV